jgi:nitroreductase
MAMNMTECIKGRRSIRKYNAERIERSVLEDIISTASFSPSWKNTQITRYIAIEDTSIIQKIADDFTPEFNSNIVRQVSTLIAVTFIKGRCGFERDGSYSTKKEDRWQMFDVGVSCQTFCLAAHEAGLGTVIMGIWDEDGISELLNIPEDQELAALIAIGYPDISPEAPRRKSVDDLLTYR